MNFVLITGASQGLGQTFAREFARRKRNMILVARSKEKLENLAHELSQQYLVKVEVVVQDLSLPHAAEDLFQACREFPVETLINNAGFGLFGDFETENFQKIDKMMAVNMYALTQLTHLFLPQIKTFKGNVINIASISAFQSVPLMAVYAATKAYVLLFSEALHYEVKKEGVNVLAVCPGPTNTGFFDFANMKLEKSPIAYQSSEQVVQTALKAIDARRAVVISGWKNKVAVFAERFLPRSVVTKIAQKTMMAQY